MNTALRSQLLAAPPAFHVWAGVPQVGGLDPPFLEFMERVIADTKGLRGIAYETGAGLSTAWLLSLGFREVRSFCDKADVCGRIDDFLKSFPEERSRWRHHIGPSQFTLPPHAIAIDDIQLGSCRLLRDLLIQPQMGYSVAGQLGKLVVLRKETGRRLLGDFGWQRPFLDRLSGLLESMP